MKRKNDFSDSTNMFKFDMKKENKQLEERIVLLKQIAGTYQEKKQLNLVAVAKLNETNKNIKEQCKNLESLVEKAKDLNVKKSKQRGDMISTIIAIVFVLTLMLVNITDVLEKDIFTSKVIFFFKIVEVFVNEQLIFHTGLLLRFDKDSCFFLTTRVTTAIVIVIVTIFFINEPNTQSFANRNYWLSCMNVFLSSVAFCVTFIGNYIDHTCTDK